MLDTFRKIYVNIQAVKQKLKLETQNVGHIHEKKKICEHPDCETKAQNGDTKCCKHSEKEKNYVNIQVVKQSSKGETQNVKNMEGVDDVMIVVNSLYFHLIQLTKKENMAIKKYGYVGKGQNMKYRIVKMKKQKKNERLLRFQIKACCDS